MEGQSQQSISNIIQLPPGFRFHPSDEELIVHYLRNKATSHPIPASIIAEVNLYNHNPWELPRKALFGEDEWYFFSPRDRKYPNGVRPNRAAASGYWKATGKDNPIFTSHGSQSIGVKKALVFYEGRPPKGRKTDWIMHEYRLLDTMIRPSRLRGSMRLDDWVLCRVRQKGNIGSNVLEDQESLSSGTVGCFPRPENEEPCLADTNTNVDMVANYLYNDCPMLAYIFAAQGSSHIETVSNINTPAGKNISSCNSVYEENSDKGNSSPFAVSSFNSLLNNPLKRKPIEGNHNGNCFSSSKKLRNNDTEYGDILSSKKVSNNESSTELNFCSQFQSQGTNFNPNSPNFILELQELDQLDFID